MLKINVASETDLSEIKRIAYETWPLTFGEILSPQQIEYMLEWMYSLPSLTEQIQEKGHVFILIKEEGESLGYVSYELNYKGIAKTSRGGTYPKSSRNRNRKSKHGFDSQRQPI